MILCEWLITSYSPWWLVVQRRPCRLLPIYYCTQKSTIISIIFVCSFDEWGLCRVWAPLLLQIFYGCDTLKRDVGFFQKAEATIFSVLLPVCVFAWALLVESYNFFLISKILLDFKISKTLFRCCFFFLIIFCTLGKNDHSLVSFVVCILTSS